MSSGDPTPKMHPDEVEIDAALVRYLLATQFPRWAHLPIERVPSAGTDNAIYRLGQDMAVRMPRIHWATEAVEKEQHWLPKLAPFLPLAIPVPLAKGEPGEGYPWHWSVYPWLEGRNAIVEPVSDLDRAAIDLAQFIAALHGIDPTGGPPPGSHNSGRGVPLATRDARTRDSIAALREQGTFDDETAAAATQAWQAALQAPVWEGPPVWVHGDLQEGNLLVQDGRITAVIDFGCLGVGDPACDLMLAWTLFSGESRHLFREALRADDATWARAGGWVLSTAVIALPYYLHTNPVIVQSAWHRINEVLGREG